MAGGGLDTQVVVVGAGPVGLMLAGELRLGGADVIVLERLARPTTQSRASTLHARTMEILDSRGLLDALGTPPGAITGHFGGIPLGLDLPGPHPGQWKVPQTRTEELLHDWAAGLGADVRRGHELRGLTVTERYAEVEAAGPRGPVRLRALCVVGCDGEDSTVRRLAGIGFPGTGPVRELIRADVAGIEVPDRRFERLENGLAIAARRGDGVTRVMVHEFGSRAGRRSGPPDFAELAAAWKRVTGEDIGGGTPLWVNAFADASRQAARYRDGRVLLAGDAAHQQMPIGGQALNLGLQDAVNLGWKLAAQVGLRAPDGLLDSYHRERHPVGRRVLDTIRAQARLLLGERDVEPLRQVLAELVADDGVRRHLAATIAGLDIRYDVGAGPDPLLGARLPHLELDTARGRTTGTALLRTGRGLLLVLTADGADRARLRSAAGPWADRVDVVTASPSPGSRPPDARAFLVRPDGYVAWTDSATTPLHTAAHRWFGAAASESTPIGRTS